VTIDTATYDKAKQYPLEHGYSLRAGAPSSIVVHSTEGRRGQSLQSAARYLYTSEAVSAHYLIGRAGEIIQFLDPAAYAAWHSGVAQSAYTNNKSIGIECLHMKGEDWPAAQKDALAWLLKRLAVAQRISSGMIDTHGQIAIRGPYVRKQDPTNWPRAEFIAWRDAVFAAPITKQYRAKHIYISQPSTGGPPYAGELAPGELVTVDKWYTTGYVHLQDGRGFVLLSDLESIT
jgi:N-acetyl-anhydromuramyl-L-alanine amidase AmpD